MALTDANPRVIAAAGPGVPITLAGTVVRGDLIGNNSGWVQADANGNILAEYVAGEDGVSGDVITVYKDAVVDNYTGGTARSTLYLSDTAGAVSETASRQVVGKVLSASTVEVSLPPTTVGKTAVAVTGLASGEYGFSSIVTQTAAKSDGVAAYFEGHLAGTATGSTYAVGAWLNIDSAATGNNEAHALDVGVYESGATLTGVIVCPLKLATYIDSTNPPLHHAMIYLNTDQSGDTPDYLIYSANKEAAAYTPGAAETATKTGDIAIYVDGGTKYIRLYDGTS